MHFFDVNSPWVVNIFTLEQFYAAPLRAPKWYKRKAGVSFGFGGKLVSFSSRDAAGGASEVCLIGCSGLLLIFLFAHLFTMYQVCVHNLAAEHSLLSRSSEFEASVHNGERSSLRLLCDKKSQESEYVSVRWSELVSLF